MLAAAGRCERSRTEKKKEKARTSEYYIWRQKRNERRKRKGGNQGTKKGKGLGRSAVAGRRGVVIPEARRETHRTGGPVYRPDVVTEGRRRKCYWRGMVLNRGSRN